MAPVPHLDSSPNFQPTTFLERGASVPFTTPMLIGARGRPAERLGLDLIVPNPSGGRGAYILPWTDLRSFCRPTMHDIQLTERIAGLPSLTPGTIRHTAARIASQGLAGRAASKSAATAMAAEEEGRVYTNFHLLVRLVQQEEPAGSSQVLPEQEHPAELELRAKRTIAVLAPRMRLESGVIAKALEDVAALLSPVGLGDRLTKARLPRAIAELKLLRREIASYPADGDEHVPPLCHAITQTADLSLRCAAATLSEARSTAEQVLVLLKRWQIDSASVSHQLARTDWLMDGWERICRLWALSTTATDRRNALDEIAGLLPVIPKEAGEWVGFHVEMEAPIRTHRRVIGHEDWRTGRCVQDTVSRNEALLAA